MAARYDARQLHCLKAMGLVPWVLRDQSAPAPHVDVTTAENSHLFPEDQPALAACLSSHGVSVVPRRGVSQSESALKGRVILLLESRHTGASSKPIDGHVWDLDKPEEQLLLAMLRSIGLVENDLCRTVPIAPAAACEELDRCVTVAELYRQVPRPVLLLVNRIDPSLSSEHHRLEADAGVAGWRLPHPAILLEHPERKRQAWEVLKLIRQTLSSS